MIKKLKEGTIHSVCLTTRERDAKLQGFELKDQNEEILLRVGDCSPNPYFNRHTYLLGSDERIIGLEATTDKKNLAYFYNFQFVVGRNPVTPLRNVTWFESSALIRDF